MLDGKTAIYESNDDESNAKSCIALLLGLAEKIEKIICKNGGGAGRFYN
jgi:hypothetical protein